MRWYQQIREAWDTDTARPIGDFIDVGDRVAVRMVWRGKGYGPESNVETTQINTVRGGKILAVEYFWDHAKALETMGLSEQDARSDSY
jgi:ketosteroid isomerase-like protein